MKVFKLLVGILVVAIIAAFLFNYPSFAEQNRNKEVGFCANCHEMKPNYYTWSVTTHNKFGCLRCHQDIKITTFAYKHWKCAIASPIEKNGIISDNVCKNCHSTQRNVTPPTDIIFPHQLHVIKQIDCVDCHGAVSHLNVAQYLKANQSLAGEAFNKVDAERLVVKQNQVPMDKCLKCHNGDMAPNKCSDCHISRKGDKRQAIN